ITIVRLFVSMTPPPPSPTLFPYTTLFRSPARPLLWSLTRWERRRQRHLPPSLRRGTRSPRLQGRADTSQQWRRRSSSRSTTDRRSEEHTSELQSLRHLVCRLLLEKQRYID